VVGTVSLAQFADWMIPDRNVFWAIHGLGITCFLFIISRRLVPLFRAEQDPRLDHPVARLGKLLRFWLGQWKHPRYKFAGTLHILIFAGFILLVLRAFAVLTIGAEHFALPGLSGRFGHLYDVVTDYAATVVFLCMIVAMVRRISVRPARYAVPAKFGKSHTADAVFLLGLIALLMAADSLFAASKAASLAQQGQPGEVLAFLSLPWILQLVIASASLGTLVALTVTAYVVHLVAFYFLLCYRPFGIQFHVETSLFSIYFAKLEKGAIKPVRWGVTDEKLDQVKSFGVKTFEDFTWKQMLDFYSCADCGRCADNCPSYAAGRPLAPRFLTTKARDYAFQHYPVLGKAKNGTPLVGTILSEDEIWSCTTCGACEEECPLLIEYIDKIVDLRRGLVDDGKVPQSLQKALKALESRGNPYGKTEKKKADWLKQPEFQQTCKVNVLDGKATADTLYFVDSITSYDDRMQSIGRCTARILTHMGKNVAVLGSAEKDSGHDVRRFGEEILFQSLRDHNTRAIQASGAQRIVTADPHAFNSLKHDYKNIPPVEHISQVIAREVKAGKIQFTRIKDEEKVYVYHDPCYLGRHNQIYEDPRNVLDAVPGLKRVEMKRSRDRAFCCGGGGLMLFYEPKEEQRMGVLRVKMAAEAGANVIVTACPFCMVNIEDAIKVAGLEGRVSAIDLTELVDRQIARAPAAAPEINSIREPELVSGR
jgi:Fe-S oxidoreductase